MSTKQAEEMRKDSAQKIIPKRHAFLVTLQNGKSTGTLGQREVPTSIGLI